MFKEDWSIDVLLTYFILRSDSKPKEWHGNRANILQCTFMFIYGRFLGTQLGCA
jgi:hypothetical protein